MFGLATDTFLLLDALVTIVGLILLITHFKVHPFVALTLAAGFLGLTSGMPVAKVMKSFQDGFGGVLGFVGIVLALGTMLGKLMADSGGADQIAQTLIRAFGKKNVHWAMMFAAFLVGIPLFFEIGFVLLIPLVFIVARRSGVSLVKIGIPLLAGLSVVHGLVPPHPGPLLAIGIFHADIGKTIFYGLIVALPTAIIAGPLFGNFISRYIPGNPSQELMDQIAKESDQGIVRQWMDLIGHPITALLAALLLAFYTFGSARGFNRQQIMKMLDQSLAPTAAIVLIVGAGGGFKQMLVDTGVGNVIGQMAVQAEISPILLAWLVAAVIRIATGSATVATITGAGIVAPVIDLVPGVNRELLVLATGAGSLILSHVNDAGFWLVKQYFNMTVAETFKTWSMMETILSIVGIIFIMLLSMVV